MGSSEQHARPEYIAVECRVCGTRLHGRREYVGRLLKCPDCGATTRIPPPPPPKRKNIPAALEGEQYELWGVDESPTQATATAHQPNYIAINCRLCDTLMYARENQVGQTIACPDCGKKHVVPKPPKGPAKKSVLAPDAETPLLDPTAAPGDRPVPRPITTRGMEFEELEDAAYNRALEKSHRTGKPLEIDQQGRPVLPRFPLLTRVVYFPFYSGCIERWASLSLGLVLALGLTLNGGPSWLFWTGDWTGAMAAIGGLAQTIIGAVFVIIWIAAMSNIFIAIISQSAVGSDRIGEWPAMNFIGSMAEMLPVLIAAIFAAAPGWMLGQFLADGGTPLYASTTLILGFPIVVLSQLAANSTWDLIELKVLVAMVRCPISMLLFYLQSALLAAVCIAAAVAVAQYNIWLPLALAPLYVGCLFLYARLLGRLAWRLSEKMTELEPTELQ